MSTCLHCLLSNSFRSPVKSLHILVVQLHSNVAVRDHRVKVVQLVVGSSSGMFCCTWIAFHLQMWMLFQHIRPVLMKGSQVYLLVGGTFLYRLRVAFNRQLVPLQRRCNDVVVDGIRSTSPLWSICFLGSWQQRPVQKGPWDLQGCLLSQPPPNNNLVAQFPINQK